jgi:hypothetical protein
MIEIVFFVLIKGRLMTRHHFLMIHVHYCRVAIATLIFTGVLAGGRPSEPPRNSLLKKVLGLSLCVLLLIILDLLLDEGIGQLEVDVDSYLLFLPLGFGPVSLMCVTSSSDHIARVEVSRAMHKGLISEIV